MALNDSVTRALHTLWQAAGGFAATSVVVQDLANGDSHDAKLALLTAGTAVVATVLSLAKSQVVQTVTKVTGARKARAQAVIDSAVQAALADYKAKESVAHVAADVAKAVVTDVTHPTPYTAS
uniref:Uncharacterized protein n=1 Tax=uncultured organism TaxID=155900 RepID=A0A7L9QBZ1_9ZZZZ|nr:hypothetical protein [uncultured organism]